MSGGTQSKPIGLIAGGGLMPVEVAASIVRRGGHVHVVNVNGGAHPGLADYPATVVHWSALGQALKALERAHVRDIIFLGTFARPELSTARWDWAFVKALPEVIRLLRQGGDDALLRALIGIFEKRGLRVVGVGDVAPDLLAGNGTLTARTPSPDHERDIGIGFALIDRLGQHDIGQAAVVSDGRIIAIEAAEGTDQMLARVAGLRGAAGATGGVLIKRAKPSQDRRVDLPAIGPGTVRNAKAAGLSGIAVASDDVLIAERDDVVSEADRAGLFVCGRALKPRDDLALVTIIEPRQIGTVPISPKARGDLVRGVRTVRDAGLFGVSSVAVVRAARVIALGAIEAADDVVGRANAYMGGRRSAMAVLGADIVINRDLVVMAAAGHYSGIVIVRRRGAADAVEDGALAAANRAGLFVARADLETEGVL